MDELINQNGAAAFLGMSQRTLEAWRLAGVGPSYVRLGHRTVRYRKADLHAYVAGSVMDAGAA